jgi:hypothetical protein
VVSRGESQEGRLAAGELEQRLPHRFTLTLRRFVHQ